MRKKPVIGILPDILEDCEYAKYSSRPWYAVRHDYAAALEQFGAVPFILPHLDDTTSLLAILDGVVIAGGDGNIPPDMYGEQQKFDFPINRRRAEYEIPLIKQILAHDMPLLGICHGMQLLNVIFGGSLYQNLTEEVPWQDTQHRSKHNRETTCHDIEVIPGTKLHNITQTDKFAVNSSHTQAVKLLGRGLRGGAVAFDGVVEAIESEAHRFVLGVEWHPEFLASAEFDRRIFKALIEASEHYNTRKFA